MYQQGAEKNNITGSVYKFNVVDPRQLACGSKFRIANMHYQIDEF
jgi:hypothetical protein